MNKYLIVKCVELSDQWECDAKRIPITMTDDWQSWATNNHDMRGSYEVYELKNNQFVRIKEYDDFFEQGMALYYWTKDQDPETDVPIVLKKFPNFTTKTPVNKEVIQFMKKLDGYDGKEFKKFGTITGTDENENAYVYGEYYDKNFDIGY